MNLVLHQFKKDIRRTRVLLALWLALVVMRFALVGWNAQPGDVAMQSLFDTLSPLTTMLEGLLILVLVPLVIHQEPLVGTSAFWFTRPISRSTLLKEKSLFALILIALPLLVQSVVFLANSVTMHDTLLAVPELVIDQLAWILVVASLAVLTPSFTRFVIVGVGLLVGLMLVTFGFQIFQLFCDIASMVNTPASLTQSRSLVSSLVQIVFGGAIVISQYVTRRTARSITLAVIGLALSLAAAHFWPWNFLKPAPITIADSQFHENGLVAPVLDGRPTTSDVPSLRGGESAKRVNGSIRMVGCPTGYLIRIENIFPVLKQANGSQLPLDESGAPSFYSTVDSDAIEQALGGIPLVNRSPLDGRGIFTALCAVSAGTYATYASVPLSYSAQLSCVAYTCVTTTELPLKKGARFVRGSNRETITNVLSQGDGVEIQMQKQSMHLLFAPEPEQENAYRLNRQNVIYVLVNRKRREAVEQKQDNSMDFAIFNLTGEPLHHQALRLSFGPEQYQSDNLFPALDRAWLADAVLVRLELTPVARFSKTLSIPDFRLDGKFDVPRVAPTHSQTNEDSLTNIVLPRDATRQQTSNYITTILKASRNQNTFTDKDPEVELLKQVGAQNVDLLIAMAGHNHNYYLNRAINALVQPDHKEMVLGALATNYDLIDAVVDHGWQKDAEPILLAGLQDESSFRPEKWAAALVSLQDPATYDTLKKRFIDRPNEALFRGLPSLPNFDLAGTVDQAWKRHRTGSSWEVGQLLSAAAQFGEPDVLDVAVKILRSNAEGLSRQYARKVLKDYSPATGATDEELLAWMDANRSRLVFDPAAKKFVLGAPTAAPAPATNTTPNPGSTEPIAPVPTH